MYQQPGTEVPQSRGFPESAPLQRLRVLTTILGFERRKFEVLKKQSSDSELAQNQRKRFPWFQ